MITGEQIRRARELLGWTRFKLSSRASLHPAIVERAEEKALPVTAYQQALLRNALEAAGVEFTDGEAPGVKLRAHAKERAGGGSCDRRMLGRGSVALVPTSRSWVKGDVDPSSSSSAAALSRRRGRSFLCRSASANLVRAASGRQRRRCLRTRALRGPSRATPDAPGTSGQLYRRGLGEA